MSQRRKIKKSVWLPTILTIYFLVMAIAYGPDLVRAGETLRLVIISAVEIAVIFLCYLFYRKRGQ